MEKLRLDPREYYAHGWWRDRLAYQDLHQWAAIRGAETASVTHSLSGEWTERLSFAELADSVNSIAAGLLDLGVAIGEPVCAQIPNWWHFHAVQLACAQVGAIFCPILPILRRREVEHILRTVRARVYIGPARFRGFDYGDMMDALVSAGDLPVRAFLINGPRGSGGTFERQFLDRSGCGRPENAYGERRPDPNVVATIQFTSGTTGAPKGVMHTHNTLHAAVQLAPFALGFTSDDVVVMPSPLAHSTGLIYGCLMPTVYGMKVVYQDQWVAETMLELIRKERGTWTIGSTPYVVDTVQACRSSGTDAHPLRMFGCSGATIPRYLARDTRQVLGAELVTIWGLTETSGASITPLGHLDRAADSDGQMSPVMEARIVDENHAEVPLGQQGRLLVRGASGFVGYFERADLTAATILDDGWIDTGDLASMDADRYIAIAGRIKDIVIRGGENVPVVEVENALSEHSGIKEVSVIGLPDPRLGERACAVVVPSDGQQLSLSDITDFLERKGFAKQFLPEGLRIVDALPRTASGKVQKYVLIQQFSQ